MKAAELFYYEDKTQGEIAALLSITRWKVGRLLQDARDRGIVRIEIVHPSARRVPLERALVERFGLKDAVVVPSLGEPDGAPLRARVAKAAAEYLGAMRPVPHILGVSWGRTMYEVATHARGEWAHGIAVVQVNGGVSRSAHGSAAVDTAVMLARKGGGSAMLLPSPAILERAETKRAIEADRTVRLVLETARRADTFLFSAGIADADSVHEESGYLSAAQLEQLRARGAVGDVLGRFVDATGTPADAELDARTVGIGLSELRAAQNAIAVISGAAKHAISRTVASTGLCTVLVTDELTAEHLVDPALCVEGVVAEAASAEPRHAMDRIARDPLESVERPSPDHIDPRRADDRLSAVAGGSAS